MGDYVKIMKCLLCGGNTNALALNRRLRDIKGDVYDDEPCDECKSDECKKRLEDHKYFVGDCGHSGFMKISALKRMLNEEGFDMIKDSKIFRIEKCPMCMGLIAEEDVQSI